MNSEKGFASLPLLLVIVGLLLAGGSAYYVTRPLSPSQSILENVQPNPVDRSAEQTQPRSQSSTAGTDISLTYPNGGEILDVGQPVQVRYTVGTALKQKISSNDRTEVYLLDSNNILVGYVGSFDANATLLNWDPKKLIHDAGLDSVSSPTPAGKYRVLVVVRPLLKPKCTNCDGGGGTLDNPYTSFSDGKFINGGQLIETQPIASDVSDSYFTVTAKKETTSDSIRIPCEPVNINAPADKGACIYKGMVEYTDTDFGFSFWYPMQWTLTKDNGMIRVRPPGSNDGFSISAFYSADMSYTDTRTNCPMGNCLSSSKHYFDKDTHTWMVQYPDGKRGERDGSFILQPGASEPADVSHNTMGQLHMFTVGTKGDNRLIPLSAHNFVLIWPELYGTHGHQTFNAFARTVVALDPSVGIHASVAEQEATIETARRELTGQ